MFYTPKIFSKFPEIFSYVGTRDFLMRPKQFHAEDGVLQQKVKELEVQFGVEKTFFLAQCQSTEAGEITDENLEEILFVDACFTKLQNISLNVVTADCVPILWYDTHKKIIGVVHAGWKGSSEKILKKTLIELKKIHQSNMKDIFLYIGPSICGGCYEVGKEVAELFLNTCFQKGEKYFLDLKAENYRQAIECGILGEHVEISPECTFELPEKYFSYRREKLKANFVSGIGMRNKKLTFPKKI